MRPFYIKGIISNLEKNKLLIESFSIGYLVEVIDGKLYSINQETLMYLYEFCYEDKYSLYGFSSIDELNMFTMLLNVKGVGPKTGLSILRSLSLEKLKTYIVEGSSDSIASLCDLAPITAREIIVTLKAKVKKRGALPRNNKILNVIQAAKNLGFKCKYIEPIIDNYLDSVLEEGEILKRVLNDLRSKNNEKKEL